MSKIDTFNLSTSEAVFPVKTQALVTPSGLAIDTHKAVVRFDKDGTNPRTIGVVGKDYKVLTNEDQFSSIEHAIVANMDKDMMEGVQVETNISLDGAWTERQYIFPRFAQELKTSSGFKTNVGFRLIAWNAYDGSSSAALISGLIDFFCHNGTIMGTAIDRSSRRHTKNLTANHFDNQVKIGIATVQGEVDRLRALSVTPMSLNDADEFLAKHFSERRSAQLLARVETEIETRGDNLFALHSALTYFGSHNSDEFGVRDTGRDTTAKTLHTRSEAVAKIMPSLYSLAA